VVEQGAHPGSVGATWTQPGKGVYNDIWLATADGSRAWRLTDIPTSPNDGIIWPRFNRTGTEIVWSQMYQAADLQPRLRTLGKPASALRVTKPPVAPRCKGAVAVSIIRARQYVYNVLPARRQVFAPRTRP
jgi:hypothetical protein